MHNHIEGGLAVAGKCIHTNIRFGSKVLRKNVRACLDKWSKNEKEKLHAYWAI